MVITISADSWLKFPMTDEVLAEAVNPLWDVITKVYRGKDAPIDRAIQRYFSLCRPVRIFPLSLPGLNGRISILCFSGITLRYGRCWMA